MPYQPKSVPRADATAGYEQIVVNPDGTPVGGGTVFLSALTPLFLLALTTPAAVKQSASGRLHWVGFYNPNTFDAWLQLFDIAVPGSVTLGGTPSPKLSLWVPAGGDRSEAWTPGMGFSAGLALAATTTPTGGTVVVTGLIVNVLYV